ncbi:MAG: response regulator [Candidatus Riflebacteria bacterium]|nr:response regulator [Candidatus Riflebacteria bacterium]
MAKILIIDDESEVREMVSMMVESAGHSAVCSPNGKNALEIFKTQSFDLIITDILMPEKEGVETIIELKDLKPRIKIIAISGGGSFGADTTLNLATLMGANKTLAKPFVKKELLDAISELLA